MRCSRLRITIAYLFPALTFLACGSGHGKNDPAAAASQLDTISFSSLLQKSRAYLDSQQEVCVKEYKINTWKEFHFDQQTGLLSFTDGTVPQLVAAVQMVGSISDSTHTWLWAWDNSSVLANIRSQIPRVKEFGEQRSFNKLTTPYWGAEESDGWQMTAIAAYLLHAKGAYKMPSHDGKNLVFVVFTSIRQADSTHLK